MPIKTQRMPEPKLTEGEIQTQIINRLRASGWLVVRMNSGGHKNHATGSYFRSYIVQGLNASAGLPDILAFKGGQFRLIEVKDAKGKLTESQRRFHDFAARYGVEVKVMRRYQDADELIEMQP